MSTFIAGKIYFCRSACDHNCVWEFRVERRTATSVWIVDVAGHERGGRRAIKTWQGVETCQPMGSYSMAPMLSADRVRQLQGA